jgi:hypothetical protein
MVKSLYIIGIVLNIFGSIVVFSDAAIYFLGNVGKNTQSILVDVIVIGFLLLISGAIIVAYGFRKGELHPIRRGSH